MLLLMPKRPRKRLRRPRGSPAPCRRYDWTGEQLLSAVNWKHGDQVPVFIPLTLIQPVSSQGSAKTKEDAEKAFQDTNKLDDEVSDMMDQLSAAEQELARKKAEADQDMMMAGMVRAVIDTSRQGDISLKSVSVLHQHCFLSLRRQTTPRRQRTTPARPRAP